ncbi:MULTISPECIES: MarR family transcriptional regulator [unclassified Undibacterium]|uniref:MarR family winged helix-turn-helix transcriptional regulator n=2 Tax=unclassified Undibacterium TaxID=2630295 RepID=UPI002B2226F7|nr:MULTISPECIES: MarR family transcriptional regulator [unclassified Undibacterium]
MLSDHISPQKFATMGKRYLRSIRLLAECMQAFEQISAQYVRQFGLTHSQFDIIATLGNTPGMCCKSLATKTLITKGTLTGVLDRLEQKGLVIRERGDQDRRQLFVKLSPAGEAVFEEVFPQMVENGARSFATYSDQDFVTLEAELRKFKASLHAGLSDLPTPQVCSLSDQVK